MNARNVEITTQFRVCHWEIVTVRKTFLAVRLITLSAVSMSETSERAIRRCARRELAKLTYAERRRRQGIVKSYFYLR